MRKILLPAIFLIFVILSIFLLLLYLLPADKKDSLMDFASHPINGVKKYVFDYKRDEGKSSPEETVFSGNKVKEFRPTQKDITDLTTGVNESLKGDVSSWRPKDSTRSIYYDNVKVMGIDLESGAINLAFDNGFQREFYTGVDGNAYINVIEGEALVSADLSDTSLQVGDKVMVCEETDLFDINNAGRKFYIIIE